MLIGLSGKKRHGKSTVTNYLVKQYRFVEVSFAWPLKEIVGKQLLGLSDSQLYGTTEQKETIDPFWGKSPRELLQIIGTDCFRDKVHPDFWVKLGQRNINSLLFKHQNIVVSDCRFPNEVKAIESLGGTMVRIFRRNYRDDGDQHPSETALDNYPFEYIITAGDGEIQELYNNVEVVLDKIRGQ